MCKVSHPAGCYLKAPFLAITGTIDQVMAQCPIRYVIIDGNQFQPYKRLPYPSILHRRDHIPAIAAAMLTKTIRDKRMEARATQYPDYG